MTFPTGEPKSQVGRLMRVLLRNPLAVDGRDFRHSLRVGHAYEVIGIMADDYQLVNDHGEPILYDPPCFEVVDAAEPSFWITTFGEDGERYAHPPGWGVPGFWESWHDGNALIRRVFAEQLAHWYPGIRLPELGRDLRTKHDPEAMLATARGELPANVRWMVGDTPLDFDFAGLHYGLRPATSEDLGGATPDQAASFVVFGRYGYAEGGGASPLIVIGHGDEAIYGVDAEREETIFLFNSSVGQFVATFAALDPHLREGRPLSADIETVVRDIDPLAYPISEWRDLIEHMISLDP
jgi:hypothetical protein